MPFPQVRNLRFKVQDTDEFVFVTVCEENAGGQIPRTRKKGIL